MYCDGLLQEHCGVERLCIYKEKGGGVVLGEAYGSALEEALAAGEEADDRREKIAYKGEAGRNRIKMASKEGNQKKKIQLVIKLMKRGENS